MCDTSERPVGQVDMGGSRIMASNGKGLSDFQEEFQQMQMLGEQDSGK